MPLDLLPALAAVKDLLHLASALGLITILACAVEGASNEPRGGGLDLARVKPELKTGFSNGGWSYDRYSELPTLDAGKRICIADIQGPAVIRHIHTTRHQPKELFARGIVLEIWFDDAKEPAVMSPLADFFGDGCNGRSTTFTSNLIECAPWSYNCYIPMPFKKRARVYLRNDTDRDCMNYSYVEWESLPKWEEDLGYFHATYRRQVFQLTKTTDRTLFEVKGSGHILGRQFSLITDEPLFRDFEFVMEGNNEVDIDGKERALDYLGTEDSFTFSWGFNNTFAGQHAGMPLIDKESPHQLSVYRFHDHMPIRFTRSLRWHINWQFEHGWTSRPEWDKRVSEGGCWVDYATVHYWYQSDPGGYHHAELEPLQQRSQVLPKPAVAVIPVTPETSRP